MSKETISLGKVNRLLWLFGLFKIRLIFFVSPKIVVFNEEEIVIRIRLNWRTKNHLNSMYLGVLAIGADLASGFHAFYFSQQSGQKISLAFKGMKSEFLSRPEGDVFFVAKVGGEVKQMVAESASTSERITRDLLVSAVTNYPSNPIEVAQFKMGLSIKVK